MRGASGTLPLPFVIGVVVLAVQAGQLPWIALILAISFSLYGLLRKIAAADALVELVDTAWATVRLPLVVPMSISPVALTPDTPSTVPIIKPAAACWNVTAPTPFAGPRRPSGVMIRCCRAISIACGNRCFLLIERY